MNSEHILSIHPLYKENRKRWKFLNDSYLGGADYQAGDYLTRYVYETDEEYTLRKKQTPLDNHCKNIIHTYSSFLFAKEPQRDLGSIKNLGAVADFIVDADLDGRSYDAFMRDASVLASIYGSAWIIVDKPATAATTRAQELEQGIRPYVSIVTPPNVLDWEFERQLNGAYQLTMVKILEQEIGPGEMYVRIYTPEETQVYYVNEGKKTDKYKLIESFPNPLGIVPIVILYNSRTDERGIGVSDINDIADVQRAIYDEHSEIEQLIRLSNHPSLVKTSNTRAAAGAGAIIEIDENLDPGLVPFLLQPNAGSLDGIINSINEKLASIDRMAHLGSVRATSQRNLSGVAMQTEFQLLSAKLIEKSKNLELAEEHIWRLFARWMNETFDGQVTYPVTFSTRDTELELRQLKEALSLFPDDPEMTLLIKNKIKTLLFYDNISTTE